MQYPDCFRIVEEKVKPERTRKKTSGDFALRKPLPQKWWIYADKRPELYRTIARMERVLVRARIANIHSMVWVPAGWVYNEKTVVFVDCPLSVMQSNVHEAWARNYSSTLRTDMQYTPSDCFETFPFPHLDDRLDSIEQTYLDHRRRVMHSRQEGLTKTYNRFHDPDESASDIQKLRDLHVGIDEAVAAAYGWTDLNLGHGFHETKQGIRFTISESACREVLARLLKLNHERHAEEVKQGLHDKKAKPASSGRGRKPKASTNTPSLKFGGDEDDPEPPDNSGEEPSLTRKGTTTKAPRADRRVQPTTTPEPPARPTPIDQIETEDIMAAFRQASRGKGWLDRDELLKEVSLIIGYQRLGPKIDEALRGHLRAAIRRTIIETDGLKLVRSGTATMADYDMEELRESLRYVMRKGTQYEREGVISSLARYLGFVRLTDPIRQAIKSAITSAIRHGILRSSSITLTRT